MHRDVVYSMDDQTIEYAAVVKAIATTYNISPNDLRKLTYVEQIMQNKDKIRHVRSIPVEIPIPDCVKVGDEQTVDISYSPNPSFSEDARDRGLNELEIAVGDLKVRFWKYAAYREWGPFGPLIIFVDKKNLKTFYRVIKKLQRVRNDRIVAPILPGRMLEEIYKNSVGFLQKGEEKEVLYKKYNIPFKRGILLSGKPGCGKTLTCKWLREICIAKNLAFKIVTMESYKRAAQHGNISGLFRMRERGLIFFDDMDVMVKDRKEGGYTELYTFLSEMDGIETSDGVVFVFTTNEIEGLDSAFVRPGRIDLFLIFKSPNDRLRQRFIETLFHENVLSQIDVEALVKRTDDYTFAEIEEVRKLFCLDLIDKKPVDLDKTMKLFEQHRTEFAERAKFGFGKMEDDAGEYYPDDDEGVPFEFFTESPGIPVVPGPGRRW